MMAANNAYTSPTAGRRQWAFDTIIYVRSAARSVFNERHRNSSLYDVQFGVIFSRYIDSFGEIAD